MTLHDLTIIDCALFLTLWMMVIYHLLIGNPIQRPLMLSIASVGLVLLSAVDLIWPQIANPNHHKGLVIFSIVVWGINAFMWMGAYRLQRSVEKEMAEREEGK